MEFPDYICHKIDQYVCLLGAYMHPFQIYARAKPEDQTGTSIQRRFYLHYILYQWCPYIANCIYVILTLIVACTGFLLSIPIS